MTVYQGHGKIFGRGNTPARVSNNYADISAVDEIVDLDNTFGAATLEPTAGNYDFSGLGTDLTYLNTQGGTKRIGVGIPWATFNSKQVLCPSHWGGLGVGYVEAANGARILRLWDSAIRTKYKALLTALGSYITGHTYGSLVSYWGGSETAANNFGGESVSAATWQAALLDVMTHAVTVLPCEVRCLAQWSLQSLETFVRDCYAAGVRQFGGPDIDPYSGSLYTNMLLYAALSDELGFDVHYNFEFANYLPTTPTRTFTFPADYVDPVWAGRTVSNTVGNADLDADFFLAIINYAVNVGHCSKISWLPRSGSSTTGQPDLGFTDGVIPAIEDAASTAIFPYGESDPPPPPPPPPSGSSFELKSAQTTLPTAGTPPVAHPVAHSLLETPKFAFFQGNKATANETNTASGSMGFGATDFTHEWAVSLRANASNPTVTNTRGSTDGCIQISLAGSDNMDYKANDGTPDATNINLSISNLPASAFLLELFAGAGDGVRRFVGTANLSTEDSAVTITATDPTTAATFQPNVAVVVTINTTFNDTSAAHALWSFGLACVDNSPATVQKCYMFKNENGVSPSEPAAKIHTTRVGGIINTSDTEAFTVDLAFTSTGATVTAKGGNGTGAAVGVLLLQLPNADMDLVDVTFPTSTGDQNINVGGSLDFGVIVGSILDTVDAIDTTNAGSFFISSFTPSVAVLTANTFEDAQTTADDRARTSLKPIYMYSHDGATELLKATYVSQSSPNVTFNFATASGATYKGFILRIYRATVLSGSEIAVTVPTVIDLSSYTDYVRLLGAGLDERKANGGNQINVSYGTPAGVFTGGSSNYPAFSAVNSAPSGALAASAARPYWTQVGDQVIISFPASQETATAAVWVNASGVDVDVTAEISDGSSSDYTATLASATTLSGAIERSLIEVDYQSVTDGETLTITLEISAVNAVGGNMSVQVAVLTNDYVPPADITKPTLPFGFPSLVSMTETSPGSGLYDATFAIQSSEKGQYSIQARLASNTAEPQPQQVESGADGNDSAADIDAHFGPTDIDFLEEANPVLADLTEGTDYKIDVMLIDDALNYIDGTYTFQITTPESGSGGGEGTYTGTTGVMHNNTNTVIPDDTAVKFSIYANGDTNSPHTQLPDAGPFDAVVASGAVTGLTFTSSGTHWVRVTDANGAECWSGPVVFS